jgi:hypothetical protein
MVRKEINFPTERDVIASDPSESVRSDEIEEVLPHYLDIVERRGMGGGLLHFALGGIAKNFRDDDAQSVQILAALIGLEQALVAAGDLKHDFAFIAARPKG